MSGALCSCGRYIPLDYYSYGCDCPVCEQEFMELMEKEHDGWHIQFPWNVVKWCPVIKCEPCQIMNPVICIGMRPNIEMGKRT